MGLRGICRGSFLRNAQAISLRAAQYHLLTVVEKEMFSRWILARGDYVQAGFKVCRNTSHDGYHPDSMAFLRPLVGATGYLLPGVVVMSRPKG